MAKSSAASNEGFDHNVDRYPRLADVLRRLLDAIDNPDLAVERVEVTALASGEATSRWWEPRAEESDGVYLPPADH